MNYYESLIMMKSSTTDSMVKELNTSLEKLISSVDGSIDKFDIWGKLRLAFPIEHKDYAYFVLARFKVPKDKVSTLPKALELLLNIKLNSTVIRYILVKLSSEAVYLAPYKRPEAFVPTSATGSSVKNFQSNNSSFKGTVNPASDVDEDDDKTVVMES